MHNGSMKLFKLNTEDWGVNPVSWSTCHGCVGVCVIVASIWGKRGWVQCTWNSKVNYSIIRPISAKDFNGIVRGCSAAAAADITSAPEHCTTIIRSKEKWPPKEYIPWNSQHLFPTSMNISRQPLSAASSILHNWPTFACCLDICKLMSVMKHLQTDHINCLYGWKITQLT